jgi:hypothetical protein
MTRAEFVQRLILNSMCDDFENVDQVVLRDVSEVAAKCVTDRRASRGREESAGARRRGLAKAYDLSTGNSDPFSGELRDMRPLDTPEVDFSTYFYPTSKGMEFHKSDRTWWPLDHDDEVSFRLDAVPRLTRNCILFSISPPGVNYCSSPANSGLRDHSK